MRHIAVLLVIPSFYSYSVAYSNGYTKIYIQSPRKATIKGFEVTQTDSYIKVRYDSPKAMYKQIVVLDAGHGGSDSGAVANGYKEKNMTLKIVQAAKSYFDNDPDIKFTIQDYLIHTQALLSVLILPMQLAQTDSTVFISTLPDLLLQELKPYTIPKDINLLQD